MSENRYRFCLLIKIVNNIGIFEIPIGKTLEFSESMQWSLITWLNKGEWVRGKNY